MKFYQYVPFCFTYIMVKAFELFSGDNVNPNVRWKKYFSNGITQENFCKFINDVKNNDPITFWSMNIAPNVFAIGLALVIIKLI